MVSHSIPLPFFQRRLAWVRSSQRPEDIGGIPDKMRTRIVKNPHALHRCLASVYYTTGKGCDHQKEMMCLGIVSLNSRDLGMDYSFELTGTNEREVMRKFIEYSETELKMPVLTADTIYRVQMAIKK
jgi:predicted small metal-binding protein